MKQPTPAEATILVYLCVHPGATTAEIADGTVEDHNSVYRWLSSLYAKNLVEREFSIHSGSYQTWKWQARTTVIAAYARVKKARR